VTLGCTNDVIESPPGSEMPGDSGGAGSGGSGGGADDVPPAMPDAAPEPPFSFFVTSMEAMIELSGSPDGFGGNLGGLTGADAICQQTAARVGTETKTWRAFLSATAGPDGNPVHAIDRIGEGPWYDRNGRLVAMNRVGLLQTRPAGDPQIIEDLPNERGEGLRQFGDTHDVMTGSNEQGMLGNTDPASTCGDWTIASGQGTRGTVRAGHSWPAQSGQGWIEAHALRGCAPGINLVQNGGGFGDCVGCSGGYGAIYCFALTP
jgi:hypothetical protein